MDKQYYTTEEISRILQVNIMTVYRWIKGGKLKSHQIGRQFRIKKEDFSKFMDSGEEVNLGDVSTSLSKFIGSGMMDYSYIENRKYPVDLTLGINPLGCSNVAKNFLQSHPIDFTKYSEVTSKTLQNKIGEVYGFKPEEILLGAGVADLLHLSLLTFTNPNEEVLMPEITFPSFEFLAILVHAIPKFIPFTENITMKDAEISSLIGSNTKIVVLCNPNNPTGMSLNARAVEMSIKYNKKTIFIIDEANIDLGGNSLIFLVKKYPNVLVMRSFSKGFGLAGLRVGFVIGHSSKIYAMMRRQTPFSVNVIGQKIAEIALDDMSFLDKSKKYCQNERKYLEEELKKLGYNFIHSDSNYLLVNVTNKFSDSKHFIKALNAKGANVVDGDDFRSLHGRYIRISPRTHDVNEKFIEIVKSL
jgi:histidinol-phosphate aminotransferase